MPDYLVDSGVALEYSIVVSFEVEFEEDIMSHEETICTFVDVPKKNIDPSRSINISDEFFMRQH